ncbi:MAG: hypothetical protein K2X82_11075 [Gemmataceae bacterium]|nr:hypothetical protein [Gemmataceae bacterium]
MLDDLMSALKGGTTPNELTPDVTELCGAIRPGVDPVYVPVRPEPGCTVSNCYPNVTRVVAERGGSQVYGWALWRQPGFMVEAEHHAAWRTPDGELIDVTPHADGEARILFLPDPGRVWEGVTIPNVRRPLTNHPLMAGYLWTCGALDRLRAEHARPGGNPVAEAAAMHVTLAVNNQLRLRMLGRNDLVRLVEKATGVTVTVGPSPKDKADRRRRDRKRKKRDG